MQQSAAVWEVISCPSGTAQLSLLLPHPCVSEEKSWLSWWQRPLECQDRVWCGHSCPSHPLPAHEDCEAGSSAGFLPSRRTPRCTHPPPHWSSNAVPTTYVSWGLGEHRALGSPESFPFEGLGCAQVPRMPILPGTSLFRLCCHLPDEHGLQCPHLGHERAHSKLLVKKTARKGGDSGGRDQEQKKRWERKWAP